MQAVILAGGFGTRLSEETHKKPKPMVEIGGKPVIWHIMNIYAAQGVNEFIICCGYKSEIIKEYFANFLIHNSDIEVDMESERINFLQSQKCKWNVKVIDTGLKTSTGGRLKRVGHLLNDKFFFTYGDGLANINLQELEEQHNKNKTLACVTAVQAPGRFGSLKITGGIASSFEEKPIGDGGWINGGFFLVDKRAVRCIEGDETDWERDVLPKMARDGNLAAYQHTNFWHAMDTLRDKRHLEKLWEENKAPWKIWN